MPAPSFIDGIQPIQSRSVPALAAPGYRSVDGFGPLRPGSIKQPVAAHPAPTVQRSAAPHTKPHPVQKAKTLMRAAVKPPTPSFKRQVTVTPHTATSVPVLTSAAAASQPSMTTDYDRQRRAGSIARSNLVQRFAPAGASPAPVAEIKPLPVRPVTSMIPVPQTTYTKPLATTMSFAPNPASRPVPAVSTVQPVQRPVATSATAPHSTATSDVFARALATAATPHHATSPPQKSRRFFNGRQLAIVSIFSLLIVLIAGLVAYQNASAIQLHLAASRAGIHAAMPAWQPSGFHVDTMTSSPGSMTLNYQNDTSGQRYSLAESASSWDSAGLLSSFVYPNNKTYDTANTSDGTTVYFYGKGSATWVRSGIWYKLVTDGSFSTAQLVNIAASTK